MKDFIHVALPGNKYELKHASWDADRHTAAFYAVFRGSHTVGPAPCDPPTGKSTASDYVYIMHMNEAGLIDSMTKVWHAWWAMKELGWAQ